MQNCHIPRFFGMSAFMLKQNLINFCEPKMSKKRGLKKILKKIKKNEKNC